MAEDSLLLLASFAKALAHRIRTPLTVVTNELSYLNTQGHDCSRAIQRSKDIAEILKVASMLGSGSPVSQDNSAICDISQSVKKIFGIESSSFISRCDFHFLESTLRIINRLMIDLSSSVSEPRFSVKLTIENSFAYLDFQCVLHDKISVPESSSSLTELFTSKLHLDLIEPPLIDAGAQRCNLDLICSLKEGVFNLRAIFKNQGVE